ncbi:hypothetical protein HDU79_000104 [Rhizoclosmatium sp. JEL0117]|nr:hypothetical protein HDU79_000104 [Rhizoclosmatium sp. JEL0117]
MDSFRTLLNQASQKAAPLASQLGERAQDLAKQAQNYAQPAISQVQEKVGQMNIGGQRRKSVPNALSPTVSASQLNQAPAVIQPEGTFLPGTSIQINNYTVTVDRFLAEGGFAHVYLVSGQNGQQAVLKRTLCPDESVLEMMRGEIGFMKLLSGHANIVTIYDAFLNKLGTGYEVYILMEYCSGGTLIDYMNTRLEVRLIEPEILEIFRDILAAVYHMHYGTPQSPVLHRDIKIENVLISADGRFKLCDFGSSTTKRVRRGVSLPTSEIRKMEDEMEKVTTLQYRAPELCDLYMRLGVSEKIDVWALGVLLYKLCYFVTPFENSGKLAILNARYDIPTHPQYSTDMTNLISFVLEADPTNRPNVYEVYSKVCRLMKVACDLVAPTVDLESQLPPPQPAVPQQTPQIQQIPTQQYTPSTTISPMRRGRPGKSSNPTSATASQSELNTTASTSTPAFQNDPWAIPSTNSVKPIPPPSKPLVSSSTRVSNSAVIDAAFSIAGTTPASTQAIPNSSTARNFNDEIENEYEVDDDDDGGFGGLTGKNSGADKYATYLKGGLNGADSDEEVDVSAVVGSRKGFEGVKLFKNSLFGTSGTRLESDKEDSGTAAGFTNLDDDDSVPSQTTPAGGAFWATEEALSAVERPGSSASTKRKPPPPVPEKPSFGATDGISSNSKFGSFWVNEAEPSRSAAEGWATEAAFENSLKKSEDQPVAQGWADPAAFEIAASAFATNTRSNSQAFGSSLAANPLIIADKQGDVAASALKKPPPPPPVRKSSDARLSATAQSQSGLTSVPSPVTPSNIPPPKPARRKPAADATN